MRRVTVAELRASVPSLDSTRLAAITFHTFITLLGDISFLFRKREYI